MGEEYERKSKKKNNITVKKVEWNEVENLYTDYFEELGYKNDGFHNSMMFDGETLGYGSIGKLSHNQKNVDVGNFTLPQHRKKGVGRSIIMNMSKIAINEGFVPVAGCWYGNAESIATLTSSGFVAENRIFYVRFR